MLHVSRISLRAIKYLSTTNDPSHEIYDQRGDPNQLQRHNKPNHSGTDAGTTVHPELGKQSDAHAHAAKPLSGIAPDTGNH